MRQRWEKLGVCLAAGVVPVALLAFSTGPPVRRTGALVDDNGMNCTACHRDNAPANSDPRGSVRIETGPYRPGQRQTVRVTVTHPEGARWGFQLTARWVADETKQAGSFTPTEDIRVQCGTSTVAAPVDAPCPTAVTEFASHRSAPRSTNGSNTFEVEWTPPAGTEQGDIILYAAGNAANSGNTNAGDRVYSTSLRIQPDPAACSLSERPQLRIIENAASNQPGLAMNTLVTLKGSNFQVPGLTRAAGAGDIRQNRYPTALGCIAVEVGGQRVPITYLQTDQINAQVPTTSTLGNVQVRVIANPDRPNQLVSDVATVSLQSYAPAFFTFDGRSIAARHPDFSVAAASTVVAGARPVRPGDVVLLYATGLGPTDPVYQAGEIPTAPVSLRDRLTVTIGGTTLQPADILYAGAAPELITGVYQLNARVPASAANGDVPVTVTIGGVTSRTGTTLAVQAQR